MRIFLLSFLLLSFSSVAQENSSSRQKAPVGFLSGQYNDVHNGRAITLTYHQPLGDNNWRVYAGLRYHLHKMVLDEAGHVYMKRFYARDQMEHFGFKLGVEKGYNVFKSFPTELYGFWDLQVSHGAIQSNQYPTYDNAGNYIGESSFPPRGPVTFLENNFGLGLRSQVSDRFGYRLFAGGGVTLIHDKQYGFTPSRSFDTWNWEFCRMFGVGVDYRLN